MSLADAYFEHARPEVVALVPEDARRIVDVGCAGGALGRALKAQRPGVEVRGVEPVASVAERARAVLDDVLTGGAEDEPPASWPKPDCVIFADVLEHLVDPWTALSRWRERLRPGGSVVASVPNVAHHSVVRGLIAGRFDYADAGILDRTHLRFFTRASIIDLFERAGLKPLRIERVTRYGRTNRLTRLLDRLGPGAMHRGLSPAILADPWTIQFLIVAR
jgi:2-polyprenyl-3-methyl-5-hydroxy-6-metoxy-1,4-benzoquinol methylase